MVVDTDAYRVEVHDETGCCQHDPHDRGDDGYATDRATGITDAKVDPAQCENEVEQHGTGKSERCDRDDPAEPTGDAEPGEFVHGQGDSGRGKGTQRRLNDDSGIHGLENRREGTDEHALDEGIGHDPTCRHASTGAHDEHRDETHQAGDNRDRPSSRKVRPDEGESEGCCRCEDEQDDTRLGDDIVQGHGRLTWLIQVSWLPHGSSADHSLTLQVRLL